jgi:hypothetical protein
MPAAIDKYKTFTFIAQSFPETFVFLFKFLDNVRIVRNVTVNVQNIPYYVIFYAFRSVCIVKSVVSVLEAVNWRRNIRDHDSSAVSSKGILQKSGQFAASIRNERVSKVILHGWGQGLDTIS